MPQKEDKVFSTMQEQLEDIVKEVNNIDKISDAKNDNHELYKKIHQIVQNYCDKSYEVCEVCGKPGKLRRDLPWIRTLCEGCYGKEKN